MATTKYQPLRETLEENDAVEDKYDPRELSSENARSTAGFQERVALFLRGGTLVRDLYNNVQIFVR